MRNISPNIAISAMNLLDGLPFRNRCTDFVSVPQVCGARESDEFTCIREEEPFVVFANGVLENFPLNGTPQSNLFLRALPFLIAKFNRNLTVSLQLLLLTCLSFRRGL